MSIIVDIFNLTTTKAAGLWGREAQLDILQEECGELVSAISRLERGRTDEVPVAEEMADVIVCMQSVILLLECEKEVKKFMQEKLVRLERRMKECKK